MPSKPDPPAHSFSSRHVRSAHDAPPAMPATATATATTGNVLRFKDQFEEEVPRRQAHRSNDNDHGPDFKDQCRSTANPRDRSAAHSSSRFAGESGLALAQPITDEPVAIIQGYVAAAQVSQEEEDQHKPSGFPPAPFADRFTDKAFLDELKGVQKEIKRLKNLAACRELSKSSRAFMDGINLVRSVQKQYSDAHKNDDSDDAKPGDAKEQWAERWALTKNEPRAAETEWAWILDEIRRTALGLLYKMCNFAMGKDTEVFNEEEEEEEQAGEQTSLDRLRDRHCLMVVDSIASLFLVMDRANCLYHMGDDATGTTGLVWYAKAAEETLPERHKNPTGSLMNKRLSFLFDEVLEPRSRDMLGRWMQVALPMRLRQQEP